MTDGGRLAPFPGRRRLCPRCTFTLAPRATGAGSIEACARCDGAFFDAAACVAALGPHGDCATWEASGFARAGGSARVECPGGHGPLGRWRVAADDRTEVEIDACATCGGVWFDAGEVRRLERGLDGAAFPPKPLPNPDAPPLRAAPWPEEIIELDDDVEDGPARRWYIFQFLTGVPVQAGERARGVPVACVALILACAVAFAVQCVVEYRGGDAPFDAWAAVPADLRRGANLGTIASHMFVHGDWFHLFGNLWFLWTFGDDVERRIGRLRFVALYLGSGVAGIAAETLLTSRPDVPVIGASGAISGLMGATMALAPGARLYVVFVFARLKVPVAIYLTVWLAFNLLHASLEPFTDVAWGTHLGGFAAGLAWALAFGRRFRDGAEPRAAG